jgi:23S rRNA (cytosine1962-C5)-methyltransferase
LSVYANTGAFAVAAAAGGGASTFTIDPAETLVQWARENLSLNGFGEPSHRAICASPADFLSAPPPESFELITIEDPTPAETRGEQAASTFQQEHAGLLRSLRERLTPEGVIFLISHDRRFKLAVDDLPGMHVREISHQTVPEDFRNRRIHRAWRIAHQRA